MKLRFFLSVVLVVLQMKAFAQQLVVSVTDDEKKPVELAYANLYSIEKTLLQTVQTDEDGFATLNITKYPVVLEVVGQGYESFSKRIDQAPAVASYSVSIRKKFTSLNEVVITGVAQPEKLKNALANYQVITKATMQAQGAVTLNDALKNQLNMNVRSDNILGSSIQMQGMTGNKVKVLIDGLPVNGRENGNINLSEINLNNVERIEIVQGPMSVVYGTDALGGVINVISKKNRKPFSLSVGTYLESVNKYNFDGALTFRLKDKHQVSLAAGRNFFEGYKNIDQPIAFGDDTLYTKRSFFFKPDEQYFSNIGYGYSAKSGFALQFNSDYLNQKITNKGSLRVWDPFLGAYAFDEYYRTKRIMNRLSMNGKLGSGTWQSQNGYFVYFRNRSRVNKNLSDLTETLTTGKGDQDTSVFSNVYLRSNYSNKFGSLQYTAGYDINMEFANSNKIEDRKKQIHDYATYASASYPLVGNKLTTQIGLRVAHNTSYKAPMIPSVNLLYTPFDKLQIRGSYTQGFRAPSLKEQYLIFIDNNHNIIGNLELIAEKSDHIQISASYQIYEKQANYLQFIATGYYNDVRDGIVLMPVNPNDSNSINYIYGNIKRQENMITSLQADGQVKNFHFQVGYSYNKTFAQAGDYNAFSAQEATANLQYSWRQPKLNFNVFYKYSSPQPFLLPSIDGNATFNGRIEAVHSCDASVEKKLFENKLQWIIGVKNVFNVQRVNISGMQVSSAHGGEGTGILLPRSVFTTLRVNIDK
ncbi:TonB-dependent receptor plug domain-containing protein [Polluticoccus soli]|uniref:TonB-dependent receptor plug domain-containing protein n=1 Tax=Polluticoccus soli TaxID=3034150 RepID=UPI0023E314E3|nr:TonB-dependent receptor [Flavipsychrobacter sp. JY13-12]